MSKGCMVALIVVGIIIVLAIVGAVVCYMYRADLIKESMVQVMGQLKTTVSENPPEGVNVEEFIAVTDGFIEKLRAQELSDDEIGELGVFMQNVSAVAGQEEPMADDVLGLQDKMIEYYPELEELLSPPEVEMEPDSLEMTEESLAE